MRALVTGVAGFIGSSLAERLIDKGYEVVGVDCFVDYYARSLKERNLSKIRESKNFQLFECNLNQLDLVPILSECELVFHQAAQAGVRASWGSYFASYCDHNINATQKLLEAAKECRNIKKIVFASSSSVYGDAETLPTSEKVVPAPVSPYGVTKLASEHLMRLYAKEARVPTVSLRYFTVYGPRQRPDMAFHRFCRAALEGKEISLYGSGEQSRDFTYIDDIVDANLLAAEKGEPGQVFNLGGGSVVTINQALEVLQRKIGKLNVKRHERQQGDALHTSADCSSAKQKLGFTPKIGVEQGLLKELAWMEELLASGVL